MIRGVSVAGILGLVSIQHAPLTHSHHPTITVAVGHHQVQGEGPADTLPVAITGEAPIISQHSQDCVDSVILETLVS